MNGKTKKKAVSKNVSSYCSAAWEYFDRNEPLPYEITGKYMFFSEDRTMLKKIAIEELENGGFHSAKVRSEEMKFGRECVLCLFYKDDSRKLELARKYQGQEGITYRYWKNEEDTLQRNYSEEFLQQLTPDQRMLFTQRKTKRSKPIK